MKKESDLPFRKTIDKRVKLILIVDYGRVCCQHLVCEAEFKTGIFPGDKTPSELKKDKRQFCNYLPLSSYFVSIKDSLQHFEENLVSLYPENSIFVLLVFFVSKVTLEGEYAIAY